MTGTLLLSLLALILSTACGFIFIPQILNFCKKRNLYDIPNERKVHKNAIPRLGGISFLPSMVIATIIALVVLSYNYRGGKLEVNSWAVAFAIGMLLIYSIGLIDDVVGLSPMTKFVAQIIAALLPPMSWLYINNFYGFMGIYAIPYYIGAPLTVFVLVFIMNAFNLIDGIDGLSGSLSLIALVGFFHCFYLEGLTVYCILIAGLAGVIVSFLFFNIFGNAEKNRKIFMGDSGSLTLGYILGTMLVKFSMNNPNVMPYRRESMLIAVTLLMVPVFDVVRVIIVRLLHHKPIFKADKNHIHHKLMRAGLTQHQALMVIICLALLFIILNTALYDTLTATMIIIIDAAIYTVFHYAIDLIVKKRGSSPYSLV
ncbi:MraY family glycosyltransferase [uncultured Prevotella sp.]|uniref:MraY family glycosyltransferase n=1 Tax=uncultured Prevotella sp. TaxID=159272 RepID=UPI00258F741C|nr:MraY family glycosyltransferase [uncultured Prevotella sp.]